MAAYNKHEAFVENLAEGAHNLGADALKVVLTNTAPTAANALLANLTEISNGNGYTTGGSAASLTSSAQASGTYKLVLGDVTWTASGGTIGPFRYTDLYNDGTTVLTNPLIAWWDYGSAVTLQIGETFTWDADPTNGILTLA
jgi:hypothetical protein